MNWNPTLRRHFLQGAGKAALVLPILPSLLSRKAEAQTLLAPKQKSFIGFPIWNHIAYQHNANEAEAKLTPSVYMPSFVNMKPTVIAGKHTIYSKLLTDAKNDNPQGRISEIIDASFNAYLPKMTMINGMDYLYMWGHHSGQFGNGHAIADAVIAAENPAIVNLEEVLANSSPNFYKNPALKGKSIHFTGNYSDSNQGTHYYGSMFAYSDPTKPTTSAVVGVNPMYDPGSLWDKYFGSFNPPPPGTGTVDHRKTLVDTVIADFKSVLGGTRLGKDDRTRIERHLQLLQDTQKTVAPTMTCTKPARPSATGNKAVLEAFNSVITSLIACGLCNSFMARTLALISDDSDKWHAWSHLGDATSQGLVKQQMNGVNALALDLAKKLDAQSLLDDSLIALPQEHGRKGHISVGASVIMFGGAGGMIKTGQFIDYRDQVGGVNGSGTDAAWSGFPYNQLWANMLMAMDVPPSEFEPLNRTVNPTFSPSNSGYGSNVFYKSMTDGHIEMPYGYGSKFHGHNMSTWLPLLHA